MIDIYMLCNLFFKSSVSAHHTLLDHLFLESRDFVRHLYLPQCLVIIFSSLMNTYETYKVCIYSLHVMREKSDFRHLVA